MTAHVPEPQRRPKRPGPPKRTQRQLIEEMMHVQMAEWSSLDMVFTDKIDAIATLLIRMFEDELSKLPQHLSQGMQRKNSAKIAAQSALFVLSKQATAFLENIK